MALNKKLETGLCTRAWAYENETVQGISVGIKGDGYYEAVFHIESVKCAEGLVNRVVIKKDFLKEKGIIIIEE